MYKRQKSIRIKSWGFCLLDPPGCLGKGGVSGNRPWTAVVYSTGRYITVKTVKMVMRVSELISPIRGIVTSYQANCHVVLY